AAGVRTRALRLHLAAARTASDWGVAGFPSGPSHEDGAIGAIPFADREAHGDTRIADREAHGDTPIADREAHGDTPIANLEPHGNTPSPGRFDDWREAESWLDSFGGELPDVVGHAVAFGEYGLACWIAEAYTDYFVRQGRYHECQTALELALPHADRSGDPRMPLALRACLGYTAIHQRRYTQARALCTEALERARRLGFPGEEARALTGLGATALSVGEGEQALAHVTAAAELCRAGGDHWLGSMALLIQGLSHQFAGRGDAALTSFTEARRHAEADGRPRMLGRILSSSADIHLRHGRYAEAVRLLTEAVRLVEQGGEVFLGARSLTRLGTAVHGRGDPGAAILLHQQALLQLQLLSPLTEPSYAWLEMDIRTRLGGALMATGRIAEARRQYDGVVRAWG
ncbi:tetratricopeptide repeat protein, partial [Streptomyces mesophilus]|uniref:tetratricopeptide repeat protein n=1 Tax=Streptomyces mesophilus TaxID=1775132 RepID=UPI00331C8C9E